MEAQAEASPWEVRPEDFPYRGAERARLEHLVRYCVLAPSSHNSQPWLFSVRGGWLECHADRERRLPVADPHDRELTISCGAALGHALLAARRFGLAPDHELLPDPLRPDLLWRLRLSQPCEPDAETLALFAAIPRRRTTRRTLIGTLLPLTAARIEALAAGAGAGARIVADAPTKEVIGHLAARADRAQFADPAFRAELAQWMHAAGSPRQDGMSAAASATAMPDALTGVAALIIRTFDLGGSVAATDRDLAQSTAAFITLATIGDEPADWLRAGVALSWVTLRLAADGLTSAYLNQPIEHAPMRLELARAVGVTGWPQLLLRAGEGPEVPPAPRRAAWRVLCS